MLYSWLRLDGTIIGKPLPSWMELCNAIHDAGENPALAESIAKEHSGIQSELPGIYIRQCNVQ